MSQLHMSVLRHVVMLESLNAALLLTVSGPVSVTVIPLPLSISLLVTLLSDRAVRPSLSTLHIAA